MRHLRALIRKSQETLLNIHNLGSEENLRLSRLLKNCREELKALESTYKLRLIP